MLREKMINLSKKKITKTFCLFGKTRNQIIFTEKGCNNMF